MSQVGSFKLMAEYNEWMNARFYDCASQLSVKQINADLGAFFGSISATLNHILVGDLMWLKRFAKHSTNFPALAELASMETPVSLDQVLYPNFSELRLARAKVDRIILDFCADLEDADFQHRLKYNNSKGLPFEKPFGLLLLHFFTHQTHHRGQVSTLLAQLDVDVGVTDLLVKIPD